MVQFLGPIINISVSTTIREEEVEKAGKWYLLLREDQSLERPVNLFVASLQTEDNNFRSFLSAWSALEIFVNKTFSLYENILFQKLNEGNHPAVRKQYLDRIQGVIKDKYRLSDKFIVISYLLRPDDADTDFAEFQKAKEVRDKLLHGKDVPEETLPVITVQNITRKYFRLHLDR